MNSARALLLILAGVQPEHEAEFNLWYDREHIPDRVGVPGFIAARRHQGLPGALWPYLALYETTGIDVFSSPTYRERLANQSAWSRRILPTFVAPQRNIALRRAQLGEGVGALTMLAALRPEASEVEPLIAAFRGIAADLRQRDPDLVSVGLYASDPDLSRPVAEYPPVASSPVGAGDWFVMADVASARGGAGFADALAALPLAQPALGIGSFALRLSVAAHDLP